MSFLKDLTSKAAQNAASKIAGKVPAVARLIDNESDTQRLNYDCEVTVNRLYKNDEMQSPKDPDNDKRMNDLISKGVGVDLFTQEKFLADSSLLLQKVAPLSNRLAFVSSIDGGSLRLNDLAPLSPSDPYFKFLPLTRAGNIPKTVCEATLSIYCYIKEKALYDGLFIRFWYLANGAPRKARVGLIYGKNCNIDVVYENGFPVLTDIDVRDESEDYEESLFGRYDDVDPDEAIARAMKWLFED